MPAASSVTDPSGRRSSAIALSPDGRLLVAVNPDSDSVSIVDTASSTVVAEVPIVSEPRSVSIDSTGAVAYVAATGSDSLVAVDLAAPGVLWSVRVGDEPRGVVAAGDNGRVYVASFGAGQVSAIDPSDQRVVGAVDMGGDPMGLALSPDGGRLYVTDFFTGRLTVIDTSTLGPTVEIASWHDANLSGSVVLSPSGEWAYLPQTRSQVGNTELLFDSIVLPVVVAMDLAAGELVPRESLALDVVDRPVGRPWDAAISPSGNRIYVVNAASNDLSIVDLDTAKGIAHVEVQDNPEGVTLSPNGARAYVNNTLAGTVSVVDTASFLVVDTIDVSDIPLEPEELLGKQLFHTSDRTDMARDQWVSCASCHPFGLMDRRVWQLASGPRNTIRLAGAGETGPITWSRERDEIQDNELTIRIFMSGTGLIRDGRSVTALGEPTAGRSPDLDALAAFVKSLSYPPNPNLDSRGRPGGQAERGRRVFTSLGTRCLACHIPPLYTDLQAHDVGTGAAASEAAGPAFDTPTLRGVYQTAPYLHDGSAATLVDVFTMRNADDEHGVTSQLSDVEIDELVAYLKSLSDGEGRNLGVSTKVFLLRAGQLLSGQGARSTGGLLAVSAWTGIVAAAAAALVLYVPYSAAWRVPAGIRARGRRTVVIVAGAWPLMGFGLSLAYAVVFTGLVLDPSWMAGAAIGAALWVFAASGTALVWAGMRVRRSVLHLTPQLATRTLVAALAAGAVAGLLQSWA